MAKDLKTSPPVQHPCLTCLSEGPTNRVESEGSATRHALQLIFPSQELHDYDWVCSWCHLALRKLETFHRQALQARSLLTSHAKLTSKETESLFPKSSVLAEVRRCQLVTSNTLLLHLEASGECKEEPEGGEACVSSVLTHTTPQAFLAEEIDCKDVKEEYNSDGDQEFDAYDDLPLSASAAAAPRLRHKHKHDRAKKKKSSKKKKVQVEGGKFNSRMVLETAQYKVIKLSHEEIVRQLQEAGQAERYIKAPYKCALCVKGFNYEDVLRNHMAKHQPEPGYLECGLCHQFLASAVSMRGHLKSHSTKYQCKECGCVKASRQHLLEHYGLLHQEAPHIYICNICGKTLVKRTMYQKHMRVHCPPTEVACDKCGKLFKTIETLRAHMLKRTMYQKHMRVHCPPTEVACDKCGKLFKTIETLRAHMLRHLEVKRYACPQCPKSFQYASLLYMHKVTHTNTRNYYCVECDQSFKTHNNLRLHLKKAQRHLDPEALKFACAECPRRYLDEKSLQQHVHVHHLRIKDYTCPLCSMRFGSRDGLRSHNKKIHEGVRPPRSHICDICSKGFRAKAVLLKHLRVHTGERPFSCSQCGKNFGQKSTLATHVRLVHLKLQRKGGQGEGQGVGEGGTNTGEGGPAAAW